MFLWSRMIIKVWGPSRSHKDMFPINELSKLKWINTQKLNRKNHWKIKNIKERRHIKKMGFQFAKLTSAPKWRNKEQINEVKQSIIIVLKNHSDSRFLTTKIIYLWKSLLRPQTGDIIAIGAFWIQNKAQAI